MFLFWFWRLSWLAVDCFIIFYFVLPFVCPTWLLTDKFKTSMKREKLEKSQVREGIRQWEEGMQSMCVITHLFLFESHTTETIEVRFFYFSFLLRNSVKYNMMLRRHEIDRVKKLPVITWSWLLDLCEDCVFTDVEVVLLLIEKDDVLSCRCLALFVHFSYNSLCFTGSCTFDFLSLSFLSCLPFEFKKH